MLRKSDSRAQRNLAHPYTGTKRNYSQRHLNHAHLKKKIVEHMFVSGGMSCATYVRGRGCARSHHCGNDEERESRGLERANVKGIK